MKSPDFPPDEAHRITALKELKLLDAPGHFLLRPCHFARWASGY